MARDKRRMVRYTREQLAFTPENRDAIREAVERLRKDPIESVEVCALAQAVELVGDSDEWKTPVELDPLTLKVHRLHWLSSKLSRLSTDDPEPVEDLSRLLDALADLTLARRDGSIRGAELAGYIVGRLVERLAIWRSVEQAARVGIDQLEKDRKFSSNRKWTGAKAGFLDVLELVEQETPGLIAREAAIAAINRMGTSPKPAPSTAERYVREARKNKKI